MRRDPGREALVLGQGSDGQLGNGAKTSSVTPVEVESLGSKGTAAIAGFKHSCGLTQSKALWCWGRNNSGQLGDGSVSDALLAVRVVSVCP